MSRITGVIVALATTTAVLTASSPASTAGGAAPGAAELPREIRGGVELTLADGDLLRLWTSKNHRTVWAARRDVAVGTWGAREVVLRKENLYCGDVDARTASGVVAVIAECDEGSYAEDQAPVSSHAIWSPDTVTWTSYELEGEAYEEPGISPDGTNAVWPEREGYVTRTEAGFVRHQLDTEGIEYTSTATISDAEQVSYLFGAQFARRCAIVVLTRTGDAEPTRQELALDNGCSDSSFANVDADTTWFGDPSEPAQRAVISRSDATSPWAVTEIAPTTAPGLVVGQVVGRRGLDTDYFTAPGLPLYAVGSRGRHVVRAQVYDRSTQSWGAPAVIHDAGTQRCRWGDNWLAQPLALVLVNLTCGGRNVVLTTGDGSAWQALGMGERPYGLSPDGRFVAVPGPSRTYVLSRELGVVTLPGGVTGRCDVVVPDGPDAAVLLTAAGRHRGWPTVLQASATEGWRTLSRTALPTFDRTCQGARSSNYELPYRFDVFGRLNGYTVRVLQRGGEWTVRRSRY
jgi:hypothetical protein